MKKAVDQLLGHPVEKPGVCASSSNPSAAAHPTAAASARNPLVITCGAPVVPADWIASVSSFTCSTNSGLTGSGVVVGDRPCGQGDAEHLVLSLDLSPLHPGDERCAGASRPQQDGLRVACDQGNSSSHCSSRRPRTDRRLKDVGGPSATCGRSATAS